MPPECYALLLGGKHTENKGYDNEKGLELQVQFEKGNFKSPQIASTFTLGQKIKKTQTTKILGSIAEWVRKFF